MRKPAFAVAAAALFSFVGIGALAQPPAPQPFPTTNGPSTSSSSRQQPPPAAPPSPVHGQAQPPATAAPNGQPDPNAALATKLGLPVFPSAQLLGSYDAGRGQKLYLFGSAASFNDLVAYYKSVLKQGGHMVFETPATYSFEVGKFDEDTMAFPPGVTIKDFQSEPTGGYPNPKPGGQPAVFPSVIQIVTAPAPAAPAGR